MDDVLSTLNRAFISVLPKQPFYDWANAVMPDAHPMTAEGQEATAYAIADDEDTLEVADLVKRHAKLIFELELFDLCNDPSTWPTQRDWKTFNAWFSYQVGSVVWDLAPQLPLRHDEQ